MCCVHRAPRGTRVEERANPVLDACTASATRPHRQPNAPLLLLGTQEKTAAFSRELLHNASHSPVVQGLAPAWTSNIF